MNKKEVWNSEDAYKAMLVSRNLRFISVDGDVFGMPKGRKGLQDYRNSYCTMNEEISLK